MCGLLTEGVEITKKGGAVGDKLCLGSSTPGRGVYGWLDKHLLTCAFLNSKKPDRREPGSRSSPITIVIFYNYGDH